MADRLVTQVVEAVQAVEGAGFKVHRPFPTLQVDQVDPFLMLDEMGPMDVAPGQARGAPDHPHRGFETVTYLLEGKSQHKDSQGHQGTLCAGDVQWMTAGAGVVHSEMPAEELLRDGGRMHGFQLWVNLPRAHKMMKPRYQEVPSSKIPEVSTEDGLVRVRVIAGASLGATAVIDTVTPIMMLHVTLQPGGHLTQPLPAGYNGFVYVFGGSGRVAQEVVARGEMACLSSDGDGVVLFNPLSSLEPVQALLLVGVPIREPVARYGPFVMNTRAELVAAVDDYEAGRMGRIS
jgi:redox-sensitive bicupin YhaK (pirin superfamily)